MEKFEPETTNTVPRLGPAPERMVPVGVMAKTQSVQSQEIALPRPRLPWLAKRLVILVLGTTVFSYAFHLTGFIPFRVLGTLFPIVYWIMICRTAAKIWGPPPDIWVMPDPSNGVERYMSLSARLARGDI